MWPWKRQLTASEVPRPLVDRLERVEKTQEDLDRSWRKLKLEWEDVYDRLEKMVGRINARARREREVAEQPPPDNHAVDEESVNTSIREGRFNVHQWRRQ